MKWLRRFGKSFLILLNIGAGLALLLAYLATYISPKDYHLPAFFGLGYGIILAVNILFIILWLFVKKRLTLISLIAIIFGFNHLQNYFQWLPRFSNKVENTKTIRVMSHNVQLFGWYSWKNNKEKRNEIFSNLEAVDPEIICFQEFYFSNTKGKFETRDTLKTLLQANNVHDHYTHEMHNEQFFGIATFSAYPIVYKGTINFNNDRNNICIFSDINVDGDTIRVYNAHIGSIRFSENDYHYLESLGDEEAQTRKAQGKYMFNKLKAAFIKRAHQVELISRHALSSPYPVIICGDFNDSPVSYSYNTITQNFTDAFGESAYGIGNTYRGKFPSFRIDYIFHDKRFNSGNYITHPESISDHHSISTEIYLKGEKREQ